MPFNSYDEIIQALSNEDSENVYFSRFWMSANTSSAGRWHELYTSPYPGGGGDLTSNGVAVQMKQSANLSGAIPISNPTVFPKTRHIIGLGALTASTVVAPAELVLVDLLLGYGGLSTSTPTTITNPVSLPRYTDGVGVKCFVSAGNTLGSGTPSFTFTYTNNGGGTSVAPAPVKSPTPSAGKSSICTYGSSPYIPLAAGDKGIKAIQSYTISSPVSGGPVNAILCKELARIPLVAANVASERDLVIQIPSLPRVYDDACLAFIMLIGGAMTPNTTIQGNIQLAWA